MLKFSVGIDVSSKKLDVAFSSIDEQQNVKFISTKSSISNTLAGFEVLESWLEKHHKQKEIPLVICMEATGVYHENVSLFLFKKGYSVSIILANKAKKYMQCLGIKSKNDRIDAKGLSQMGAEQALKKWQPLGEFFYKLRSMTRQNQNIQELKTILNNQIHALEFGMYLEKNVLEQLESTIELLEGQLKKLSQTFEEYLKSEPEVYDKALKMSSIKGVGLLTVATILAETNGFELFENTAQLVSYAGYDVVENQSGRHNGKTRISKKGNSRLRRCLHMPAFSVVQHQVPIFRNLYQRTYAKHGIKMKSYVAVQKKLLILLYTLWNKNESFDSDFYLKKDTEVIVNQEDNNPVIILEEERKLFSVPHVLHQKKCSLTQSQATQGKHSVSDHVASSVR